MRTLNVTITKERHKNQPYTATIDIGGPSKADKVPGRFGLRNNARRAAKNKLKQTGELFYSGYLSGWTWTDSKKRKHLVKWHYEDNTKPKAKK